MNSTNAALPQYDLDSASLDLLGNVPAMSDRQSLRLDMLANGFTPLPTSAKGCYLAEWSTVSVTPSIIAEWERRSDHSTGLRTGNDIIGIDIDVLDEATADKIELKVRELCGGNPPVRVGRAPKRLLLVRGGGTDLRKHRTPVFVSSDGDAHLVEVLANGQQTIAFGIHPKTNKPYEWVGGISPLNMEAQNLPCMTLTQVQALLRFAVVEFRRNGWTVKGNDKGEAGSGARRGHGKTGHRFEDIAEALLSIPNDGPPNWSQWDTFRKGFHEECGGSEEGLQIFLEWSERNHSFNNKSRQETKRDWRSLKPGQPGNIGGGQICLTAKDYGWSEPVKISDDEFEDQGEADEFDDILGTPEEVGLPTLAKRPDNATAMRT